MSSWSAKFIYLRIFFLYSSRLSLNTPATDLTFEFTAYDSLSTCTFCKLILPVFLTYGFSVFVSESISLKGGCIDELAFLGTEICVIFSVSYWLEVPLLYIAFVITSCFKSVLLLHIAVWTVLSFVNSRPNSLESTALVEFNLFASPPLF